MKYILFIILLIFLIILCLISRKYESKIPKKIWTYWHDKSHIPETVKKCIYTWRVNNPSYEITILDKNSIKLLCNIDLTELNIDPKFHTRYADFARLFVIEKFGGFEQLHQTFIFFYFSLLISEKLNSA